jgi:agmatine/peptidylarginine deiminase
VNSVIANDVVVMPSYGSDDVQARATLERAFPKRQVIPVDCRDLAVGAVHCLTKEIM